MTKLPQSNIYSASADDFRALFDDYVTGDESRPVLVLSERPLGNDARDALEKSFASFGYGDRACTYATLFPGDPTQEGGDVPLDPQALFLLVEGFDPLCAVCADAACATSLGHAYRTEFALDSANRLFGRPAIMFSDFPALLQSTAGKQTAWRLLKSLPKQA